MRRVVQQWTQTSRAKLCDTIKRNVDTDSQILQKMAAFLKILREQKLELWFG